MVAGALANQAEIRDVVARYRLLKPDYPQRRQLRCQTQRLLRIASAVGVHHQRRLGTDRRPRLGDTLWIALRVGSNLHLDEPAAEIVNPARELLRNLPVGHPGESAAPVNRHRVVPEPKGSSARTAERAQNNGPPIFLLTGPANTIP